MPLHRTHLFQTALLLCWSAIISSQPKPSASAGASGASAAGGVHWDSYSLQPVFNPEGRFYTYAPTVIVQRSAEHIWNCQNAQDGVIRDHIVYIRRERGRLSQSRTVLAPGPPGSWDSFHVCDPSVIRTSVLFAGTRFSYAMFYLGFPTAGEAERAPKRSRHNQIGVAFAQRIGGPWTKFPRPLITFSSEDANSTEWGVGQPSALSMEGAGGGRGRVLLFYTQGDRAGTRGMRRALDISDMSRPDVGAALAVTDRGLSPSGSGGGDWLNNFDVAYDAARDRFWAVREQHPYPASHPRYIGASLQVVSIEGASIWRGGGAWRVEGSITPDTSGFPRSHNGGLARTASGALPNRDRLSVFFSRSCADSGEFACATPEWSYDLWKISGTI